MDDELDRCPFEIAAAELRRLGPVSEVPTSG